jgi:hypothetical protein
MRIFRDTVCKEHVYQNVTNIACVAGPQFYGGPDLQRAGQIWPNGAQKEFMWCFHFTKTKIIDVRDFAHTVE